MLLSRLVQLDDDDTAVTAAAAAAMIFFLGSLASSLFLWLATSGLWFRLVLRGTGWDGNGRR
jgi:hypothetical protein